ncbi:MAG: DUF6174 domain-containing protein [Solirubrobacteraceae bacterium]|nr:DUF6174 domain-containing protein [Solirubrobacteraceae bacterium]
MRVYRMTVRLSCFCPTTTPTAVTVRRARSRGRVPSHLRSYATVPRLFARVQEAIDRRAAAIDVQYAGRTGRPVTLAVDHSLMIADEEQHVTVRRFRRLAAKR